MRKKFNLIFRVCVCVCVGQYLSVRAHRSVTLDIQTASIGCCGLTESNTFLCPPMRWLLQAGDEAPVIYPIPSYRANRRCEFYMAIMLRS